MKKIRVAVTSPSFSANLILRQELKNVFDHICFNDSKKNLSSQEMPQFIGQSEALIVGLEKVDSHLLQCCPNLRVVSKYGVGLNNIDFEATNLKKIPVLYSPGVNRRSVSELTIGYMLGISRNIFNSVMNIRSGLWVKDGGFEISEKKVGIIGFGNIGQDVARLLAPFGTTILVNDIKPIDNLVEVLKYKTSSIEKILRECDIVSLHVPYDQSTHHLIGEKELDMLKDGAILINTSRGGIVDEGALARCIESKNIFVALDVFEIEPQIGTLLTESKKVYCTPHIGGNSKEAVLSMGRAAIENLKQHFKLEQ
jgi:phosphoglycerate dehydrogenase-like enzyme